MMSSFSFYHNGFQKSAAEEVSESGCNWKRFNQFHNIHCLEWSALKTTDVNHLKYWKHSFEAVLKTLWKKGKNCSFCSKGLYNCLHQKNG